METEYKEPSTDTQKNNSECRFHIPQDRWYMSDTEYKEFCKEVRKVYKAVMVGKNKVMVREDFARNTNLYYVKLISEQDKKEKHILLNSKRTKIYKKIGIFMYYSLKGKKPSEIKIVKLDKPMKKKKFIKGKQNGKKFVKGNYQGNRKTFNTKK